MENQKFADPYFEVGREKLNRLNGEYTKHDVIHRLDNNEQLSVVTKDYRIITHQEAMEPVVDALTHLGMDFQPKHELAKNGAKLFTTIHLPGYHFDPARNTGVPNTALDGDQNTDQYAPTLILENAYDKTSGFNLTFGMFRFVCSNGMRIGKTIGEVKYRHFGNVDISSVEQFVSNNITGSIESINNLYIMGNTTWGTTLLDQFIMMEAISERYKKLLTDKLSPFGSPIMSEQKDKERPKVIGFEVKERFTEYLLYNALTSIATHNTKSPMARVALDKTIANMFGV